MLTEKLYIAKQENGEQIGPCDADTLIKLAENGTITATTEIRSKLIADWNKASSVDFLKEIIFKQQQAKLEEMAQNKDKTKAELFWEKVYLTAPEIQGTIGLVKVDLQTLPPAPPAFRLAAGIIDLLIVLIGCGAILYGAQSLLDSEIILDNDNCVPLTVIVMMLFTLFYFTFLIAFKSQTIGQRFMGIFLIRMDGKPFWIGRVFFFSVLLLLFGLLTPFFFMTNAKTVHELLTNTRLAKVIIPKNR